MHITSTTAVQPHQAPEPPRPVQQEAQVSSRPVVQPAEAEASAKETRRDDERRANREENRNKEVENRRAESKTKAESRAQAEATSRRDNNDGVGSKVDVYA